MAYRPVQTAEIQALKPENFPILDLIQPEMLLRETDEGALQVRDHLRRKWLVLSPEEWVRQHVVFWLLQQSGFPASLLSLEKGLPGSNTGRTDVLGFNRLGRPLLLVECKAAQVGISSATVIQAMAYNEVVGARFVWLSNGRQHKVLELNPDFSLKKEHAILPDFSRMESMADLV
jgi:hypothetical protein